MSTFPCILHTTTRVDHVVFQFHIHYNVSRSEIQKEPSVSFDTAGNFIELDYKNPKLYKKVLKYYEIVVLNSMMIPMILMKWLSIFSKKILPKKESPFDVELIEGVLTEEEENSFFNNLFHFLEKSLRITQVFRHKLIFHGYFNKRVTTILFLNYINLWVLKKS